MTNDVHSAGAPARSRRRIRVIFRNCAIAAGLLLASAAVAERWCEAKDFERYASKETFANVGQARVRYRLLGAEHAAPPVVFLTGMIGSLEQWDVVQSRVSAFAPALAYDRAGGGFSSDSNAHDAQQQGDELAGLLVALGLNRPVIIVGYSASGSLARVFTAKHRAQVSSLLLIDPSVPEMDLRVPGRHGPYRTYARTLITCSLLSLFGVRRMANEFGYLKFEPPPRTDMDYRALAVLQRFPHWWAFDRELLAHASTDREVLAEPSPDVPMTILLTGSAHEDEHSRVYTQIVRERVAGRRGVMKDLSVNDHSLVFNQEDSLNQIVEGIRDLTLHPSSE
jgi:pimeloyl-ACP methyl ester carboxylesterase